MTYEEAINFLKSHQPMPDTLVPLPWENKELLVNWLMKLNH